MNPRDLNLQNVAPTVMVPRFEPLAAIRPDSHRYLAAENGFYLEVARPWLHGVFQISESPLRLPYGKVEPRFDLSIGSKLLKSGLSAFILAARRAAPDEYAAWLLFSPATRDICSYYEPDVISKGRAHIDYERPVATPTSLPVIDCHSHGHFESGFSPTDDEDDLIDDVKIAFVVGSLNCENITISARLVGLGLNICISEWAGALVENHGIANATRISP